MNNRAVDRKIIGVLTVVLIVTAMAFVFIYIYEYVKEQEPMTPQEIYNKIIKSKAEHWDTNCSLLLVWGKETEEDGFIFPDWYYLPSSNPEYDEKRKIVGDPLIGDGKAPIWVFIFYSQNKHSLYEIKGISYKRIWMGMQPNRGNHAF